MSSLRHMQCNLMVLIIKAEIWHDRYNDHRVNNELLMTKVTETLITGIVKIVKFTGK